MNQSIEKTQKNGKRFPGFFIVQAWLVLFLAAFFGAALAGIQLTLAPKIEANKLNETLEKVQHAGITTDEGCRIMLGFKDLFIKHLENEDRNFYPVLNDAAKKNPSLQVTMDVFAREMLAISDKVFKFFKNLEEDCNFKEAPQDFGEILSELTVRVRREERILFKEYEKLEYDLAE